MKKFLLTTAGVARRESMKVSFLRTSLLIATLASIPLCHSAYAADFTASRLHQLCVSKDDAEQIACRYYLFGVFEGLSFGDSTVRKPENKFVIRARTHLCPPDNVSADQLIKVFVDAAQGLTARSSEYLNQAALPIVDAAYGHAFPCQLP
jgi:hypothetical protein